MMQSGRKGGETMFDSFGPVIAQLLSIHVRALCNIIHVRCLLLLFLFPKLTSCTRAQSTAGRRSSRTRDQKPSSKVPGLMWSEAWVVPLCWCFTMSSRSWHTKLSTNPQGNPLLCLSLISGDTVITAWWIYSVGVYSMTAQVRRVGEPKVYISHLGHANRQSFSKSQAGGDFVMTHMMMSLQVMLPMLVSLWSKLRRPMCYAVTTLILINYFIKNKNVLF